MINYELKNFCALRANPATGMETWDPLFMSLFLKKCLNLYLLLILLIYLQSEGTNLIDNLGITLVLLISLIH